MDARGRLVLVGTKRTGVDLVKMDLLGMPEGVINVGGGNRLKKALRWGWGDRGFCLCGRKKDKKNWKNQTTKKTRNVGLHKFSEGKTKKTWGGKKRGGEKKRKNLNG